MPTYTIPFSVWSGAQWTSPGSAQLLDSVYASELFNFDGNPHLSGRLVGTSIAPMPVFGGGETLASVAVTVFKGQDQYTVASVLTDYEILLVVAGTPLTAVNLADTATPWPTVQGGVSGHAYTYLFTPGNLTTLGITIASVTATFGACLQASYSGARSGGPGPSPSFRVDQMYATLNTVVSGGHGSSQGERQPPINVFPKLGQVR